VRSLKAARVNIVVRKFASERRSIRSSAQQLYARHVYSWRDIRWQHRYKDITSVSSQGRFLLDYTKFHDTVSEE
jgi:inward rectifier potassium channel